MIIDQPIQKMPESVEKVRFQDCDPFNHLNNSKYIDYLMTARVDHLLDHYGFDVYKIAAEKGVGWVSAHTEISYLLPAFPNEKVVIQTQLLDWTEKSLLFEASMWNEDKTQLKSLMWGRIVHFNLRTQRSEAHSETFIKFFKQVVNPVELNFKERVSELKRKIENGTPA
jgi:YbgC/YbaW family acyl-CoA thioester hydrolase